MIKDIFYSARPKYWAWLFVAMFMLLLSKCAYAQTLPSGWVGRVQNNVANQWATYTFTFTPSVSGSQYIMFAFRQDPAYWYFDNAKLTVQGQTTNLLTNPDFVTGGSLSVNTANYGQLYINAPTAWGVGYQSGIYPSAAGTWSNGQWIDGAVGSFDSIYQAVTLTAGTTYVITFDAMSNNTVDNNAVQLGVYAGQCTNLSMAPANCSLPASSGFETVAAPSLTATTGCTTNCPQSPTTVTVVSTSITYTTRNAVSGNTTQIYRTPVTTTTYSDNSTTTTTGTESLYQTRVARTIVTNKIVNGVLTTYSTPVVKVTMADTGVSTLEANGTQTSSSQNVNTGLRYEAWKYDSQNYSCGWLGCVAIPFSYHSPSTNRNDYGNPARTGLTTNGMFFATNSDLPNNDSGLFKNYDTVVRFRGTITAPITASKPAGTVYRLYFYNNSDDGFKMTINGGTIINQDSTNTYQSLFGYTSSGYMDVVAGQTYNIEAWYWNVKGGFGHTLYWDFGDGRRTIPNSAFTDGTIDNIDIDLTGFSYSNAIIVPIEGTAMALWPESDGITTTQLATKDSAKDRVANLNLGNQIYIEEKIGSSNNSVTIEQSGSYNKIAGLGGTTYAIIDGDNNTLNIKQGSVLGKNLIEFSIIGNTNNITLWQARNESTGLGNATDSGGHYTGLNLSGNSNTLTVKQSNDGGTGSGQFALIDITGNSNQGLLKQSGNNGKLFFGILSGNSNIFDITQQGTGSHFLDLTLTGNGNNATVNQKDSASHKATINLVNAGGAITLNLTQQGTTAQSIGISQQCATLSGCSVTVTQGGGP